MDGKIKEQICEVFDKYDKGYSNDGVNRNFNAWKENKKWLVELLRKHPNWNEDALAVVFEVTHIREIDRDVVNEMTYALSQLSLELDLSGDERDRFRWSLDAVAHTYSKNLQSADTADSVKSYCGVSCSVGQKNSRIINAICKKYGIDKHSEYNARFAKLADSLNPMQIKRTALLSVHPCDFLEMSNRDNSWSSCHCLDCGEYHAGTLSYMNDGCSMIFYTVDEDVTEDFYKAPKRTRQVFCYKDGILLQSRLYPQTDDDESRDMYRNIVQRTIADCLEVPNLWTLKRNQEEIHNHAATHEEALHYPDYEHKCYKANVSLLKDSVSENNQIIIGNTGYCIECPEQICENGSLYCDACNDDGYVHCYDCDYRVHEDYARYINGRPYCESCCSYCEHCHEYTRDAVTEVEGRDGYSRYVCEYCLEGHYRYCEDCEKYFLVDDGCCLDDGFHCNDCYEYNYSPCDGCGEFVRSQNMEEVVCGYQIASDYPPSSRLVPQKHTASR